MKSRVAPALLVAVFLAFDAESQCVVGSNSYLEFASPTFARTPAVTTFAGSTDFTVEAWARVDSVSNYSPFVQASPATGFSPRLFWLGVTPAGKASIWFDDNNATITGASNLVGNGWHHVAAVRQGGVVALYVDGVQEGPVGVYAAAMAGGGVAVSIGRDSLGLQLDGGLDEVRIWGLARTPGQIQSSMGVGLTGGEAGLLGYWRFDEASGQTAFNTATATGAALNATLGADVLFSPDDPAWSTTGLPPIAYCPPCPNPPCGQINTPCASLVVNGVGVGAQGPFSIMATPGASVTLTWNGPPLQPYVLVGTSNLIPGQVAFTPTFLIDVNIGNFVFLYGGFDPIIGPFFFTDASGTSSQSFSAPSPAIGATIYFQGVVYDLGLTCPGSIGLMTTASFSVTI